MRMQLGKFEAESERPVSKARVRFSEAITIVDALFKYKLYMEDRERGLYEDMRAKLVEYGYGTQVTKNQIIRLREILLMVKGRANGRDHERGNGLGSNRDGEGYKRAR